MVRVLIVVFTLVERASACTAALAARGATADGSSLLLHTDDCLNCDFRIARVPPVPESEPTRVTKFREQFPRDVSTRSATYDPDSLGSRLPSSLLDTWRSREWAANQTLAVLDAIEPSVLAAVGATAPGGQTLGTLEGLYAIANTAQVALAETTCAALPSLWSPARTPRGTRREGALWDISALSRVALARCPTARCAIDLMGYLAVTEGFYGQHGAPAEASANGETLLIADVHESWVLHMAPLPPAVAAAAGAPDSDGGHSALWVAQRVPDGHFVAAANRYIIRDVIEVRPDSLTEVTRACRGDDFRHSRNLFTIAEHLTSLTPDPKPLEGLPAHRRGVRAHGGDGLRVVDWLVHFGGDDHLELAPYSNDRLWRALSIFASDREWPWPPPTPLATDVYPFSTRPARPLTAGDFLGLIRDVYKGAKAASLDLTRGLAAGPYGDPSRYDVPSPFVPPGAGGSFPRAISMFRTSYSFVTQVGRPVLDAPSSAHGAADGAAPARPPAAARVWTAQGAPHAAIYTPLHVLPAAADAASDASAVALPTSFTQGSLHRADVFDAPTAEHTSHFWRTALVNHWARAVGFDLAWGTIFAAQQRTEKAMSAAADVAEAAAASATSVSEAAALLAQSDRENAARASQAWSDLVIELMTTLHDGYRVPEPLAHTSIDVRKIFYPQWWLERVGYYGPKFYPCYGPCAADGSNRILPGDNGAPGISAAQQAAMPAQQAALPAQAALAVPAVQAAPAAVEAAPAVQEVQATAAVGPTALAQLPRGTDAASTTPSAAALVGGSAGSGGSGAWLWSVGLVAFGVVLGGGASRVSASRKRHETADAFGGEYLAFGGGAAAA